MSANDPDDFVKQEIDWIGVPLREEKPFLGLCLGAQMLAKHMGATVWEHPGGRAEIGYYPLVPTEAGHAAADRWGVPGRAMSITGIGKDSTVPPGAETLATGDDFPTQAIGVGARAFGLQFHPEVTHAMMCRWTVRASERLAAARSAGSRAPDRGPLHARSARGALAQRLPRRLAWRNRCGRGCAEAGLDRSRSGAARAQPVRSCLHA